MERLVESAVGLAALAIAALTLWVCYGMLFQPESVGTSRRALWGVAYILVVVSAAVMLYGLRLLVPRLRVEGGRVIGVQGLAAFAALYAFMMVFAMWHGTATVPQLVPGLFLLAGLAILIRFRSRRGQP